VQECPPQAEQPMLAAATAEGERISRLEAEVETLKREFSELKERLESFQNQFK
jgi:chaperonin cofactor prefoldin